jgi:hypothetical protein
MWHRIAGDFPLLMSRQDKYDADKGHAATAVGTLFKGFKREAASFTEKIMATFPLGLGLSG